MGIDLGTCNTLVCVRGEGIVLNEPSVVAVHKGTNKVIRHRDGSLAVGWAAKEMLGKTPGSISAIRPLKDGVISDFEITEALLKYFIGKVQGRRFMGPRVVIAVPSGITAVEKRAVIDSAATRAKPIVLTGLAAMIGALFILDDPIFNGLAIALIFGILVSTLLTLVVIPVLYYAVMRRKLANPANPAPQPQEAT